MRRGNGERRRRPARAARAGVAARTPLPVYAALALCACTRVIELEGAGAPAPEAGAAPEAGDRDAAAGGAETLPAEPACGRLQLLDAEVGRPLLLLVLERSASMLEPLQPGGANTRLSAVREALLQALARSPVAVGLVGFPGPVEADCAAGRSCCSAALLLPPSRIVGDGVQSWGRVLACPSPADPGCAPASDSAPLGRGLDVAAEVLRGLRAPHLHRHVLVLSDGDPSCPGEPEPCAAALIAATALAQQDGVGVSVIGLSSAAARTSCLSGVALAGGRASSRSGPVGGGGLAVAESLEQLGQLLREVLDELSVAACTVTVRSGLPSVEAIRVFVDGRALPRVDAGGQGWTLDPASRSRLLIVGPECDRLRSAGRVEVSVYGCCPTRSGCPLLLNDARP